MQNHEIWSPIHFDTNWCNINTEKFDNIYPSWEHRRKELLKNPKQYNAFLEQLKRKQAIDTGIIERMYDLKRGITETFIKEGFAEAYLQHGDTDIAPNLLMSYLSDNIDAIDFIFDFVKNNRRLSISYIKELHCLITRHQEYTEGIDQFGNHMQIPLLKGIFKTTPNNPLRAETIYHYCPPEQVDSEMDNLISIFNNELVGFHPLIKAAFLHHAFVQIHPFQDGNGRIARLLASFVLIKEGLFPLSIDRDERAKYISALENADKKDYQPLIDIFSNNQISSIERALNWKTVEDNSSYENVLGILNERISAYQAAKEEQQNKLILQNMCNIFEEMKNCLEEYKNDLISKMSANIRIDNTFCSPHDQETYYYAHQISSYATEYHYYANLSLNKCWGRMFIAVDSSRRYRLIMSIHHYGFDNSTFAIGAFLSRDISKKPDDHTQKKEYMDVPLGIPPLTFSSERNVQELTKSIQQQVEIAIMASLAYIANELT